MRLVLAAIASSSFSTAVAGASGHSAHASHVATTATAGTWRQYASAAPGRTCSYSLHYDVLGYVAKGTSLDRVTSTSRTALGTVVNTIEHEVVSVSGAGHHVNVTTQTSSPSLLLATGGLAIKPRQVNDDGIRVTFENYESVPSLSQLRAGVRSHGLEHAIVTPTSSTMRSVFASLLNHENQPLTITYAYTVRSAPAPSSLTLGGSTFTHLVGFSDTVGASSYTNLSDVAALLFDGSATKVAGVLSQTSYYARGAGLVEAVGAGSTVRVTHCS